MEEVMKNFIKKLKITKHEFQIVNNNFYKRLESAGDLSLIIGEAYMAEEWISTDLVSFLRKVMIIDNFTELLFSTFENTSINTSKLMVNMVLHDIKSQFKESIQNNQLVKLFKKNEINDQNQNQNQNIPDILYEYMLDIQRQYTCGYWKPNTTSLEESHENKINLLIDKLQIPDNTEMNILDIGCGWGYLPNAISKRYPKCNIEGISISKEQIKFANNNYKSNKLKYYVCDYKNLPKIKKYDRIINVGTFEYISEKNFNNFFKICETILTNDGIFIFNIITKLTETDQNTGSDKTFTIKWIDKYIYPSRCIQTIEQIESSFQSQGLIYHHNQNLSSCYAKTLQEWYNNINKNWKIIKKSNPSFFTTEFYNMWEFYLLCYMVSFETKRMYLTQYVLTKKKYNNKYIFHQK